jgi:hypothetical protein
MRSHYKHFLSIFLSLVLTLPVVVYAQDEDEALVLRINRDFGYGGGSQIQGRFSMRVSGPDDLEWVEFLLDGEVVGEDREPPFRYSFSTDDYSPGVHRLSAIGYTQVGGQLASVTYSYEFISAAEARSKAIRLVIPILAIIAVMSLVTLVVPSLLGKNKGSFRMGEYGAAGGAVCPRCAFPYSRHVLAPNLVMGKLGRCPHCGKWAIVRRASPEDLDQAESRLREDHDRGRGMVESDRDQDLERLLEDSRFED